MTMMREQIAVLEPPLNALHCKPYVSAAQQQRLSNGFAAPTLCLFLILGLET